MTKEVIATGKTVEAAVESGAAALGQPAERVSYEILEEPRKGILGIGAVEAKLRVFLTDTPALRAAEFVEKLIENMQLDATVRVLKEDEEGIALSVEGENLGLLIGRRGDVLDALQYLAGLVANHIDNTYYRITLDIGNYRQKREQALSGLGRCPSDVRKGPEIQKELCAGAHERIRAENHSFGVPEDRRRLDALGRRGRGSENRDFSGKEIRDKDCGTPRFTPARMVYTAQ